MNNRKTTKTTMPEAVKAGAEERPLANRESQGGPAAAAPIGWPTDWPTSEGFPVANGDCTPDGKHTWVEQDTALSEQGSCLADRIEALAGPKAGGD